MTYKELLVDKQSFTELDLDFPHYDEKDNANTIINCIETWSEAPSINIDDVLEYLQKLKSVGATHVYIADHSDHLGYYIEGVKYEQVEQLKKEKNL